MGSSSSKSNYNKRSITITTNTGTTTIMSETEFDESDIEGHVQSESKEPVIVQLMNHKFSGCGRTEMYYTGSAIEIVTKRGEKHYLFHGVGIVTYYNLTWSGVFINGKMTVCTSFQHKDEPVLTCTKFYPNDTKNNVYKLVISDSWIEPMINNAVSKNRGQIVIMGKLKYRTLDFNAEDDWYVDRRDKIYTFSTIEPCQIFDNADKKIYEIVIDDTKPKLVIGKQFDIAGRVIFDGNFININNFQRLDKNGYGVVYDYDGDKVNKKTCLFINNVPVMTHGVEEEYKETSEASAPSN